MNGTLSHTQSPLVTRDELLTISPPPATSTWKPIAHADLIQAIDRQLLVRGITIQREQFALQRDGARLFAVLDLAFEQTDEFCAAMGVRNSTDKSLALDIAVGLRVFVCENLAFSGDLIALHRKHTVKFDLNADISRAVDRYQQHLAAFHKQVNELKEERLTELEAKGIIYDVFGRQILPVRLFPAVVAHYAHQAPHDEWGLHNVLTTAVKQLAPAPAFQATVNLGRFFHLGVDGRENGDG